jgi:hypothetical protein
MLIPSESLERAKGINHHMQLGCFDQTVPLHAQAQMGWK